MSAEEEARERTNDEVRDLVRSIEEHNPSRAGHGERVASYAVATAYEMGVRGDELLGIRYAAAIHDLWKLKASKGVIERAGAIESGELPDLLDAPFVAARELSRERGWPWAELIGWQYRWWDGSDAPGTAAGENIPLGSRIIFVATAFDVMTTAQPWTAARTEEEAIEELKRCSGTQFDPKVVEAFLKVQPLIQPVVL